MKSWARDTIETCMAVLPKPIEALLHGIRAEDPSTLQTG